LANERYLMSAPFRIERPSGLRETGGGGDTFKDYLERLLKMIPGEVVGAYLIGAGFIPPPNRVALAVWAAICLILVVIVRVYGTADPARQLRAQPIPVFVSAVAFVIWVYSMGGPFEKFGLHISYVGSLAVLLWSFLIPFFYKGS
jgi:hypothetical protein